MIKLVGSRQVTGPQQARVILAEISKTYPDLVAFFGCLYFAALRPELSVSGSR